MNSATHLAQLRWRHKQLDRQVEEAYKNYYPDEEVNRLKHERFHIKEQIRLLEEENGQDIQNSKRATG